MSLTASESGGGDFTPVAEGTHIARCVRIIDLGVQPGSLQYPESKQKVLFVWEVPGEQETDAPGQLMKRYTMSLHKKAGLRADLESWRGRAFTEPELKGFALKNVLDAACMIAVVHSPDGKFANVRSVSKMPRGVGCPERVLDLVYYEIEDGHNTVYHALSQKLRATVDVGAAGVSLPPAAIPHPAEHEPEPEFDDESVPF